MEHENRAIIEQVYARFGAGDVPGLLALLDPAVSWEYVGRASDYPVLGPRHGHAGVQAFLADIAASEEITAFEAGEMHASGDKVFVLGRAAYVVKRTGKPAASPWVHVFTLAGGKVVAFQGYIDTAQLAAAYRG